MALAPDPARGDADEAGDANSEEEITGEEGDVSEVEAEVDGKGESVCGKDGAQTSGKDGGNGQDQSDEVAAPQGPVQRVVGVV